MCHGPNKAFLVPDSCRATERKGNSISGDVTDDTIENDQNDACFSYFQTIWQLFLDFLILQDKHNIGTLSGNIEFICTRFRNRQKMEVYSISMQRKHVNLDKKDMLEILDWTGFLHKISGKMICKAKKMFENKYSILLSQCI